MGIALFTTARLPSPVQALLNHCLAATARHFSRYNADAWPQPMAAARVAPRMAASRPVPCVAKRPQRPLRVVRVLEGAHGSRTIARLVISGRMADVCAELERLAAAEGPCT